MPAASSFVNWRRIDSNAFSRDYFWQLLRNWERLLSHSSDLSGVLTFDLNPDQMKPLSTQFDVTYIE